MISMVLPASAIMYASGSTDNSDDASDGEFTENSFLSDSGSTMIIVMTAPHQIVGLPRI